MNTVYLSLGSNIGNRREYLIKTIEGLKEGFISINNISSFYETEPIGFKDQPFFLNMAVKAQTELNPYELLAACKMIEIKVGRTQKERWHEREIDIDIIFYNDITLISDVLEIPHREFYNRKFVLEPLNEIAPDFVCPKIKKTISEILSECKDTSAIKRIM